MTRLIKRYGSRKLYDPAESRYVSLEDLSQWVRDGEDVKVIDNASSEDVTAQTLTQVIAEEGRKKSRFLSSDVLHQLIRAGEHAVNNGVRQIQDGMDRFMKKSIDRITPVRSVRDEMAQLRDRLDELEAALDRDPTTAAEADTTTAAKAAAKRSTAKRGRSTSSKTRQTTKSSGSTKPKTATRKTAAVKTKSGTGTRSRKSTAAKSAKAEES